MSGFGPAKGESDRIEGAEDRAAWRRAHLVVWGLMLACVAVAAAAHAAFGQQELPGKPPAETVAPIFQRALPNAEGKTFTSVIVDLPPAATAAPHRHGAAFVHAYVFVSNTGDAVKVDDPGTR